MKKLTNLKALLAIILVTMLLLPAGVLAAVDDSYTVSLLHMDGTDASTTFSDESGITWTPAGNAQIDTAQSVFGGASGLFDGTGDYISATNSYLALGTGDFTIDTRIRINSLGPGNFSIYDNRNSTGGPGNQSFVWYMKPSGKMAIYIPESETEFNTTLSINTWYHVALVRNGATWKVYINGTAESATITNTGNLINQTTIIGSGYDGGSFNGWIDEFRISKGIARWISDFTPPTSEYEPAPTATPTITNTPTIIDTPTITNTPTITLTPTATVSTATPTPTLTHTYTPTNTSTHTLTPTLSSAIEWAPSPFSITTALQNALATALIAATPSGSSGDVYGVINAQSDGSGGWYISLVNIVGISPPYTGWNMQDHSKWTGSMDCVGTEPIWTCSYYTPSAILGGTGGLVFPWQTGTYAIYGVEGIHHDGSVLPGDDAVDFVGGDELGASAMPPYVYAAEAGTVTWSCQGAHNGGIIITGASGKFMYFHLAPGQAAFTIGTIFQQGAQIGKLAYGTFDDSPCGYASQGATDYHIHFAWLPSGNTLSIGGCILDFSTGNWLCGTTTIGILGHLVNSGGSSPAPTASGPTVTPGGPTLTPNPGQIGSGTGTAVGGEHVWNGLIQAVIDFINTNARNLLGVHTPNPSIAFAVNNLWTTTMSFGWMIQALQMITIIPALLIWGIILFIEVIRWIYIGYRTIVRLIPIP